MRRRWAALALTVAVALGIAIGLATSGSSRSSSRPAPPASGSRAQHKEPARTTAVHRSAHPKPPTDLGRLVGQLIVGRYSGPSPSAAFLARVRAGELGAVILFSDNTAAGVQATRRAIAELQSAARKGGNPPLLVMTDQEGGDVRRLPGPPGRAPADMESAAVARAEGAAAGRLLRSVGVNVDLAPVADVKRASISFLGSRAFGSSPSVVAPRACAFAQGLKSAGVAYTLKHFPGLGAASANTDLQPVTIPLARAELRADYAAYRSCGSSPDALIMISSAVYPAVSGSSPAVTSPAVYERELPAALGNAGHITISDALDTPALKGQSNPALRAIDAGLDLALFPGNERESALAYKELVADARRGVLPESRLRSAAYAVEALKRLVR